MNYLVIPEITEHEELLSVSFDDGGRTARVIINLSSTATQLLEASVQGKSLPLVVVATDATTYALDNVVVSEASIGSDQGEPLMSATFLAEAVRFI
jgi:hypothetical protein